MVCRSGAFICVPNHSLTGTKLCLPASVKCDGKDDCLSGEDEEDCGGLQSAGLKALVAWLVIAAVITAAVVGYVLFRRSRGKPVIPVKLRAMVCRILPCCAQTKGAETSSQQLNVRDNHSTSPNSIDKDGFTNVGFQSNPSSTQVHSKLSVTGKPLNKFGQTVQTGDSDSLPSYRDWQSNRLQPPVQSSSDSHSKGGQIQHRAEINEQPAEQHNGVNKITYAPSAQRQRSSQQQPYAIASSNARNNYERPSYTRQTYGQHANNQPNQYLLGGGGSQGPQVTYSSASTAVAADELREALKRVAVAPSSGAYGQRSPRSTADDTVV